MEYKQHAAVIFLEDRFLDQLHGRVYVHCATIDAFCDHVELLSIVIEKKSRIDRIDGKLWPKRRQKGFEWVQIGCQFIVGCTIAVIGPCDAQHPGDEIRTNLPPSRIGGSERRPPISALRLRV